MMFHKKIEAIYQRLENHILPFMGDAYDHPQPDDLRVMGLGINSYISKGNWPPRPEWFASWFKQPKYRFFCGARRYFITLASELHTSKYFSELSYRDLHGAYLTNAIKTYLSEATGKKACQVASSQYEKYLPQWREELDTMAKYGVLPHLLVVFGQPFWRYACNTFSQDTKFKHISRLYPHANLYKVVGSAAGHHLLLVGVAHPSAPRGKVTTKWLCSQKDFRNIIGLPEAK